MRIQTSAPSNIAVIKYMGKLPNGKNNPTNASLSLTLNSLRTFIELEAKSKTVELQAKDKTVELEAEDKTQDEWQALKSSETIPFSMSSKSQQRFLKHLAFMKKEFGVTENFLVKSANNFPSDCGLASSASSFAALTLAFKKYLELNTQQRRFASEAASAGVLTEASPDLGDSLFGGSQKFQDLKKETVIEQIERWAQISRLGSGSSCRSFFGPWVEWSEDGSIRAHEFAMEPLLHSVVIVEAEKKSVSSSEAHQRVVTSPYFQGRPERANRRLKELLALWKMHPQSELTWKKSFEIIWDEFIDMHQLFETCEQPFKYMNAHTMTVLKYLEDLWRREAQGPLVTMDAGANIHLIFKASQMSLKEKLESDLRAFKFFQSGIINNHG